MRRFILFCCPVLLLLAGCAISGADIPEGLSWRAQTLTDQEDGTLLAAWGNWADAWDAPLLDVTAQVEEGTVTLTDHTGGGVYSCVLTPMEEAEPGTNVYALTLPDHPEGYAVYGVTKHADGKREATLYLVAADRCLCLTAPLSGD